jgi:hypothetical protein
VSKEEAMPPPSLARQFFDGIVQATDPVAEVRALINSDPPTFETDWRDFKTEHHDPKQRDDKARETWSKALGGFANNQGGVLIWGVDARKKKVGEAEIDFACGEKPVDNPQALKSRLIEFQRGAVDPPLANVETEAFPLPDDPGKGFVVCYVPEGPFKPYRSEQAGQQWFMRAGDNTVVMSRSVLQSLFYPRSKAVFRVRVTLSWELLDKQAAGGRDVARLDCNVELVNDGTATARNAVVLHTEPTGSFPVNKYQTDLWGTYNRPDGFEFASHRPLHPGRWTPLFQSQREVEARASASSRHKVVPYCPAPSLSLVVFCENQERQDIQITFDMEELIATRRCVREAKAVE